MKNIKNAIQIIILLLQINYNKLEKIKFFLQH